MYTGQNVNAADKVIDQLLLAMGLSEELRQELKDERARLKRVHKMTSSEVSTVTARIDALQHDIGTTTTSISNMQASLGTSASKRWKSMRGDAYLRARVNARAMRATIRSTLVSYKFERRKVERTFRHQLMRASTRPRADKQHDADAACRGEGARTDTRPHPSPREESRGAGTQV